MTQPTSGGKAREFEYSVEDIRAHVGGKSAYWSDRALNHLCDAYTALEQDLAEAKALLNQSIGMTNVTLLEKLTIAIEYLERIKIQNLDGLPDCPRIAAEGLEKIK